MQQIIKLSLILVFLMMLASCSRPIAKFTYTGKTEAPASIQFSNTSEKAETYEWDFGDGKTSTSPSPVHKYLAPGDYTIMLKAKKGDKVTTKEQKLTIMKAKDYFVEIETNFGKMRIRLYNETPQHRDNFLKLAREGYYDDLLFHRVISGFMLQGGDPNSRDADAKTRLGGGGPGYRVPAELGQHHFKGALAAARTNNPAKESSGSQFYIVQGKPVDEDGLIKMGRQKGIKYSEEDIARYMSEGGTPFLDADYTVYGMVVEGLDVIDKIAAIKTAPGDRPVEDVKMKVTVLEAQ